MVTRISPSANRLQHYFAESGIDGLRDKTRKPGMAPIAADSSTIDVTAKPNKVAKKTEGPILASDGLSLNLVRTHVRTPGMSGERRLHLSRGAARLLNPLVQRLRGRAPIHRQLASLLRIVPQVEVDQGLVRNARDTRIHLPRQHSARAFSHLAAHGTWP